MKMDEKQLDKRKTMIAVMTMTEMMVQKRRR